MLLITCDGRRRNMFFNTEDATVKAVVRFVPLLAFLLLSLLGFNLCLTILQEASQPKGKRLDIQVRCGELPGRVVCLASGVTGTSRRERRRYREYSP